MHVNPPPVVRGDTPPTGSLRIMKTPVGTSTLVILLVSNLCFAQPGSLRKNMKHLSPVVGNWDVNTTIIERSGRRTEEKGTYACTWALDSTYVQIDATLTSETGKSRKFKCLITFSASIALYPVKYFYSGTAFTVDETGLYDPTTKTFSTKGTLNIGGKTEGVRTLLDMSNRNEMKFMSWATFEGDGSEFLDFRAVLRRTL